MSLKIRVLIADDSEDIVALYEQLLNGEADLECVETLSSARGLDQAVEILRPHIAIVDLSMPGPEPLGTVAELAPKHPECRFLAFSGYDDPATRDRALDAGFWGLVSKHDHPTKLIEEIRRIAPRRSGG